MTAPKKQPRKAFKVWKGNTHLTVYPWEHPATGAQRWRFGWRKHEGEPWRYVTKKTKAEAETAAETKLELILKGGFAWDELPPARQRFLQEIDRETSVDDEVALLEFLRSRKRSAEVVTSVARFMDGKVSEAGELTPYLRLMRAALEGMADHFKGKNVADIHLPELQEWLSQRTDNLSAKRKKDIRGDLVQFWGWCQIEGIAGRDPVTVAARIPRVGLGDHERRILTPVELSKLLDAVDVEWRAWVVLGAFAGMRPEEIAPSHNKKKGKRGLHCEEIDWQFNCIRVPGCVAKGKKPRPRNIPLSEACRVGLLWAGIKPGMKGPVCLRNPATEEETLRLGKEVFGGTWPQDALRHSYASYRNALIRSLGQVAEEMGNSIAMLNKHYHNPRAEEEGKAWFAVRPGVPICSDQEQSQGDSRAIG